MKKILLISTGGTIACVKTKDGLVPRLTTMDLLSYVPKAKKLCDVTTSAVCNIDSTNVEIKHWQMIVREIENNYEEYDGFVVCHGTDTLAYTAAALSYMIQNSKKPIVITGSQKPINEENTDAVKNLCDSFICALDEKTHNVNVVFDGKVIAGTRARKNKSKSYDAFVSLNYPFVATIENDVLAHLVEEEIITGDVRFYYEMSDKVCTLKLVPGMKPEILTYLFSKYDCILIEGFGVGGVPKTLEDVLYSELKKGNKSIVMATQIQNEGTDMSLYEVGKLIKDEFNLIETFDMTFEAAVAKLMWIFGGEYKSYTDIRNCFYKRINRDITNVK